MRKAVPLIVGFALAATTVTACGGDSGSSGGKGDIKIGFIESLSGNYQPLGTEAKKAVELAVEQLNAEGGLNGRKIELITKNDETSPEKAVLAFNELKDKKVAAILGSTFSNSAMAVMPLAERAKIPYVSLAPADEQVNPVKPYTFVVPATSGKYAEAMLQYLQSAQITKIVVAYDAKTAYSQAGWDGMKKYAQQYGVQILKEEPYETGQSDFSPLFAHTRDSGAQMLVAWGSGAPGVTIAKQYAASGLKEKNIPLMMTGSQASKLWLDPVGPAAEGVFVQSAVGVVGDTLPEGKLKAAIQKMSDPFKAKYGYTPPQFAQDGYSGMQLLAEAVKKAGGTDAKKIRDALESSQLVTPNGKFVYTEKDHSGLRPTDISMNKVTGGQLVPVDWAKAQLAKVASDAG